MAGFIRPTAIVEPKVAIGENTRILDNAHLRGPARIGRECIVGERTSIARDVIIADRVQIDASVRIFAGTTIESGVTIAAGATIGPDLIIGRFATIGLTSTVTRSVPEFHFVTGNPARSTALVCRCGQAFLKLHHGHLHSHDDVECPACGLRYAVDDGYVIELTPPKTTLMAAKTLVDA
jgi:acyl-[acyl carrier protein]--UDP-N-acetylglucosamine O-acyltransferase